MHYTVYLKLYTFCLRRSTASLSTVYAKSLLPVCSCNGASGSPDAAPYDTASTIAQKVSINVLTAGGYSTDFPESPTPKTSHPFRTSRHRPQLRILKPLAVNSPYELLRAGNYLEKPAAKAKIFLLKNAGAVSSNVSIVKLHCNFHFNRLCSRIILICILLLSFFVCIMFRLCLSILT